MEATSLESSHADAVGMALARAFMDDPLCCYVIPREQRRWSLLSWTFPRIARAAARHGQSYTTSDCAGGALWRSPELSLWVWVGDHIRAGLLLAPLKLHPGELLRLHKVHAEGFSRMRNNIKSPHWVLDVLGVSPERQGKGVSSCILAPVLTKADVLDQPCYLMTNKESNIAIYNRFGFDVIAEGMLKGTSLPFFEMRRRKASERI